MRWAELVRSNTANAAVVADSPVLIVSQTHCRPRPALDIDLTPAYLSPGNSEAGAGPVG